MVDADKKELMKLVFLVCEAALNSDSKHEHGNTYCELDTVTQINALVDWIEHYNKDKQYANK
jgi:hypothetical protein